MKKFSKCFKRIIMASIIVVFLFWGNKVNAGFLDNAQGVNDEIQNQVNTSTSVGGILSAGSEWIEHGKSSQPNNAGVDNFVDSFIVVGRILVAIGIATLVIVSVIMAIRWLTATPDKQAKLKQQLIGLVVSTVVIFGAVGIWNLVRGIMENVETKLISDNGNHIVIVASNEDNINN